MCPEITGVYPAALNIWHVTYDFADASFAMTVAAQDAPEARQIAYESLALL
jgi:hypothetical protein